MRSRLKYDGQVERDALLFYRAASLKLVSIFASSLDTTILYCP